MLADVYKGYTVRAFVWKLWNEQFEASAGVDLASRRVGASGALACFPTSEEAQALGLAWAKDWVDSQVSR